MDSLQELYIKQCMALGLIKRNSALINLLPDSASRNSELTELDLRQNVVGPKGVQTLLPVISAAENLHTILLNNNHLTNESIQELVAVLQKHPGITKLDLRDNKITTAAGKDLLALTKRNRNVVELITTGTVIRPLMTNCIAFQLEKNVRQKKSASSPTASIRSTGSVSFQPFSFGCDVAGDDSDDETAHQRQLMELANANAPSPRAMTPQEEQSLHARYQGKNMRRKTVSSAAYDEETVRQYKLTHHSKTPQQIETLSAMLSTHSLFSHLDDRELVEIVMAFKRDVFTQGQYVYREGDYQETGDRLYVIVDGDCEVLKDGKGVSTLKACDIFGELEVMYCKSREESVRVVSGALESYSLDREAYQHIMSGTFLKKRELHTQLLEVGFLKNLTHAEKIQIADALEPQTFEDGEFLISHGEEGKWFYIVVEGVVEVYGRDSDGVVIKVCDFSVGDCVGELEFIHNHRTVADVRAKGHVRTLRMSRPHFELCMGPVIEILERNAGADNPTYNYYNATTSGAEIHATTEGFSFGGFGFGAAPMSDDDDGTASSSSGDLGDAPDPNRLSTPPSGPGGVPLHLQLGRRKTVHSERISEKELLSFRHKVIAKSEEDTQKLTTVLHNTPLFSQLDDRELQVAIEAMDLRDFKEGDDIITQGDDDPDDTNFYFIKQGQCVAIIDGVEKHKLGEQDFFGELELLYSQPRQATIRVVSATVSCWMLGRDTYRMIMTRTFMQKRKKYTEFLAKVDLCKSLSNKELVQLADALTPGVFKQGELMIAYGEEGKWFHIIVEGTVEVIGRDAEGKEIRVCEFTVGDCVGELEFIYDHRTVADVKAKTEEVRSAKLHRAHFEMCMGPIVDLLKSNAGTDNKTYDYYNKSAKKEALKPETPMGDGAAAEACEVAFGVGFSFGGAAQPDDSDDEPDADKSDDIMSPRLQVRQMAAQRRCTVMTERLTQSDAENFTPEVVPKSKGDEEILRSVLEKNYLFKHLDDRELNVAVQAMFEVKFNTGEVVLEEGAESTAQSRFYVLTEGFCTVIKEGEDEQTIKPNDTIGEIELMYSQPAACTIVAHSKVTTWALDRHTYRHLVSGIFAKKRNLYEEFLSKIGFLKPLSKRELVQLADALQPHTCEAGDYMIRYGQEPDWFYIIVEGVVEVYGRDSAEQTIKVCEFGEGDCVGELEFINNHKTVADVVAKTHLRAAKLNRQHFEMCMGPVKDLLARAREGDEKFSYYQNRMAGGNV